MELSTKVNDFFILLFSILVEGMPFILIGAVLSSVVAIYFPQKKLLGILPKKKFPQLLTVSLIGNIFPVCECGNVPFARRLIKKNLPHYLALTFLLAAPVVNPIVIVSTLAAFPGDHMILVYRLVFSLIIAIGAGYLFSYFSAKNVLNKKLEQECCAHPHDHHEAESKSIANIVKKEFLEITSIFLFGAAIAATIQLFLPQDLILSFQQSEWMSILAMMALAFIISICSNVDAFFALAYSQIFPTSSIIAFLVFGPMIDIKAIPMLRLIFNWRAIVMIVSFVATMSFLLAYLYFLIN